jgi:hypothetical protein
MIFTSNNNVFAAIWEPEQEISTDVSTEWQYTPSIAVDNGEIHVAWRNSRAGDSDIYYKRFNGTDWEPELEINSDSGTEPQMGPSIAVENGEVHVVWWDFGDGDYDIFYRHFNGITWEPEQEISTDASMENQTGPSIAVEDDKVHVVWMDKGGGDIDIFYRYYNGTAWEPEQEISSNTSGAWQSSPSIAVENGEVHVVWEDDLIGDTDIYYRHFNGTAWQPEQDISSGMFGTSQIQPSIAIESGIVHVVWTDTGFTGDANIRYRQFNGTEWTPIEGISTFESNKDRYFPSIAVESTRVFVVWANQGSGGYYDIHYRYFNGTDWELEQEISTDTSNEDQDSPSIAVENARVHVVWEDDGDGDWDIYYRSGMEATPPEIMNVVVYSPDPPEVGAFVNISCYVTDNEQLDSVWVRITYPDDSWYNISMISSIGNQWYYNDTYYLLGVYDYIIWANDILDNWNSTSVMTFMIQDSIDPRIIINVPTYGPYSENPGNVIDVDFSNLGGSNLDYAEWDTDSAFGSPTTIFSIDTPTYEANWNFIWNDINEGWNTIYIRCYDLAGNHNESFVDIEIDTNPPGIEHTIITSGIASIPINITVNVTDGGSGIFNVLLYYKNPDDLIYSIKQMEVIGDTYYAEIPGSEVSSDGLEYYIKAEDNANPPNIIYYSINGQTGTKPSESNDIDITITIDITPPLIENNSPTGTNVIINTNITISFNEPMNQTSVQSSFSISPSVIGSFHWNGNTLKFDPSTNLTYYTVYNVTIGTGTTDIVGNPLESVTSWEFTTILEIGVILPDVDRMEPEGNEMDVRVGIEIEIWFTENMNPDTTWEAIYIDPYVEIIPDWPLENYIVLRPRNPLKYDTKYTIRISTNATDENGQPLAEEFESTFFTEKSPGEGKESFWETWEPIITGLMILASFIAFLIGFVSIRRKRDKLRQYLERIDNTFNEYKNDYKICEHELITLREDIKGDVKKGKIAENHFLILDKKIDDYLLQMKTQKEESVEIDHIGKDIKAVPEQDIISEESD